MACLLRCRVEWVLASGAQRRVETWGDNGESCGGGDRHLSLFIVITSTFVIFNVQPSKGIWFYRDAYQPQSTQIDARALPLDHFWRRNRNLGCRRQVCEEPARRSPVPVGLLSIFPASTLSRTHGGHDGHNFNGQFPRVIPYL